VGYTFGILEVDPCGSLVDLQNKNAIKKSRARNPLARII